MAPLVEQNGHIRVGHGSCEGVAIVTDAVQPGLLFTDFLDVGSPSNSLVHRVPDPLTNRYRFKLGKGKLTKIGESPYKSSFEKMSFVPRTLASAASRGFPTTACSRTRAI